MSQPIVRRNIFSLNGKIESTYGTRNAPSPTTDAIGIQYSSASPPQMVVESLDYDGNPGDNAAGLGPLPYVPPTGRSTQLSVPIYFRGYGAAYSAPNTPKNGFHTLMQAAGFTPTGSFTGGSEKFTYAPTADSVTPVGMSLDINDGQIDGTSNYRQAQSLGTLFNMKFDISGGKPPLFTFDGKGIYPSDIAEQTFTTPTLANTPALANSAGLVFSYGGVTLQCYSAAFDCVRTLFPHNPLNSSIMHLGWCPAGWKPVLKVNVDRTLLATFNPYAIRAAMSTSATLLTFNTGTQYNRFTLNGAQVQIVGVKENTRGNIGTYDLDLLFLPSTVGGNDFLNIVTD